MSIHNKSTALSFIRGSDIWWHRFQLLLKNLWRVVLVFLAASIVSFVITTHITMSDTEREYAIDNRLSGLAQALLLRSSKFDLEVPDAAGHQEKVRMTAKETYEVTLGAWDLVSERVVFAMTVALLLGGFASRYVFTLQVKRGEEYATDEFLKGAKLVSAAELQKIVDDGKEGGEFHIGGVTIPKSKILRNVLFTGAMGSGKSQAMNQMKDIARATGKKVVTYDKTGEDTERYYRPGKDFLLNPLDARCVPWSIFADLKNDFDFTMGATYFVPDNKKSSDPVWDNSARILLEDVMRIVYKRGPGNRSMRDVADIVTTSHLEVLASMLKYHNCSSAGIINPENQRGSESVRLTLAASPALRFFRYLPDAQAGQPEFSIREWAKTEDDSWLFITSRSDQHEAIKPFATAWIEMVITGIMERRPDPDQLRLMLFLDEIASLNRMKGLEIALTEARKYGVSTVIGLQNLAQWDRVYDQDMTKVLASNCQNKLILRVEDESTAKRYADLLGKSDLEEKSEGNSFGDDPSRDGVNISTRRIERSVATFSDILKLPDLEGYLKLSGNYPVAKIFVEPKSRPVLQPDYVPRDGLGIEQGLIDDGYEGSDKNHSHIKDDAAETKQESFFDDFYQTL